MVLAGGEDLHKVYDLALKFVEAVEGAPAIAAIVVLPRLVWVKRREAGSRSRFFDFGVWRVAGCVREEERLLSIAAILPPKQAVWSGRVRCSNTGRCPLNSAISHWLLAVSSWRFVVGYFFLRFLCGTGTLAGAFMLADC
jgi:hypothetical protein